MGNSITSRQRVLAALDHKTTDRVPRDMGGVLCGFMEGAYKNLKKHLNLEPLDCEIPHPDWFVILDIDERILKRFDIDFRYVYLGGSSEYKKVIREGNTWIDELGFTRRFTGTYGEVVDHPLRYAKDISDIHKFKFFDAYDPARIEGLREKAENLYNNTDYAITAESPFIGLLEGAHWFRGFEQFPVDLMIDKPMAHAVLDKMTTYCIELFDAYLSAVGPYIQVVHTSDDLAGQENLLISPALYREMVLPYQKKLVDFIRTKTDAKIFHHCCGASVYAADLFLESGVDIVNSLQPRARSMDSTYFKDNYGKQLVFHGGIDIQYVLPFGTPEEVQEEVKRRLAIWAPDGGYIVFAAHDIQPDTPPQNIVTMYDTLDEWGNYPLAEELIKLRETIPSTLK
jgi:uroporphyrinogen decarboxylase